MLIRRPSNDTWNQSKIHKTLHYEFIVLISIHLSNFITIATDKVILDLSLKLLILSKFVSLLSWEIAKGLVIHVGQDTMLTERQNGDKQMDRQIHKLWLLMQFGQKIFIPISNSIFIRTNVDVNFTFMPISIADRSEKGTSRVSISYNIIEKLHMSAARTLISSGFLCSAVIQHSSTL